MYLSTETLPRSVAKWHENASILESLYASFAFVKPIRIEFIRMVIEVGMTMQSIDRQNNLITLLDKHTSAIKIG